MNTVQFVFEIVLFAFGILAYYGIKWVWIRRRYPYRWTCPRCSFTIKTNVRETYEVSKTSHNHVSNEEYR